MKEVLVYDYGFVAQVLAIILALWAIGSVGNNNWSVYPSPNENSSISSKGPYAYIRHPMYTSILFFFLPVISREPEWISILVYAILTITLMFKIRYEEKQLVIRHPDYESFMANTRKRLIPFIW